MDFALSEEQQAYIDSARAFAAGALAPHAAHWDEASIFPKDALRAVLTPPLAVGGHAAALGLSPSELNDLIAYLRSL